MKGFTLLSAMALTTTALVGVAAAQKSVPSAELNAVDARTVYTTQMPEIRRIDLRGDFQPAGSLPDPYLYLQTMFARWNDQGLYGLSFFSFAGNRTIGEDVVLLGGAPDPGTLGYDTVTPVACVSEITFAILTTDSVGGDLVLRMDIHPWNGIFGNAAGASIANTTLTLNIPPVSTGFAIYLVTVPATNLQLPKAFWVAFTPEAGTTINVSNVGLLIANGTPGNVSMLPGRGYFRFATPPTLFTSVINGSVFTGLPQGSFYLAIRGKHNFVGEVNMGALDARALPSDPLFFEFVDRDNAEEALRRNLVDVEVVNDSGVQPFTSRFTTYLDENGRFTLPVTGAIASVTVRRWDNGLAVAFSRPAGGWSTDVCDPTVASATMTFGDVNGDGVIDDADLLTVLFGFGSSE
jgi:hypothetical protein